MMSRTRRIIVSSAITTALVASVAAIGGAHDLFLRPHDFVVRVGAAVQVRVLNGNFTGSEGAVARDRLRDLAVVGPSGRVAADRSGWTEAAKESHWRVVLNEPGTHVLGASLTPRTIRLTGAQFNEYLAEEGLAHVVDARKAAGRLDHGAHERYAKHVKALVRANGSASRGPSADTAYRIPLGYPAELVPLDDPYVLGRRGSLRVRAMVDGRPVRDQVVQAGGRTLAGERIPQRELRTDAMGVVRFEPTTRGTWYVKFISMRAVPASARDSVDYESKWATLTFARP